MKNLTVKDIVVLCMVLFLFYHLTILAYATLTGITINPAANKEIMLVVLGALINYMSAGDNKDKTAG